MSKQSHSNTRLVFSTDPKDNQKCPRCLSLIRDCKCIVEDSPDKAFVAIFRLEKSGRGGKIVTVIDGLPKNEDWLKTLCKELKNKCGSGGTHLIGEKFGLIEIQGDKRDQIKKIFESKGIKFKGM